MPIDTDTYEMTVEGKKALLEDNLEMVAVELSKMNYGKKCRLHTLTLNEDNLGNRIRNLCSSLDNIMKNNRYPHFRFYITPPRLAGNWVLEVRREY